MLSNSFARFCWIFCAYLIAVILFGAVVRITGSGAGCGNHWPTCQGVVLPPEPTTKTLIELTHRVTSALSGLMGLAAVAWAFKLKSPARPWSIAMLVFLLLEGFIGAVLVKKELVENDASVNRAVVISLHLANTLLLMLSAAVMAIRANRPATRIRPALYPAMAALVLVSMTGAVTALGDTLCPTQPTLDGDLFAKIKQDVSLGHHFLVRLRALHPILAITAAIAIFLQFTRLQSRWAKLGLLLIAFQTTLGVLNIALAAPPWMQLLHLLLAQLLWLTVIALWQDQ
jgi:heme a synthase